jgi:hypothetical protein
MLMKCKSSSEPLLPPEALEASEATVAYPSSGKFEHSLLNREALLIATMGLSIS